MSAPARPISGTPGWARQPGPACFHLCVLFWATEEKEEEVEEEGKEEEVVAKIQDQIVETILFAQEPVQQHTVLASTCRCHSSWNGLLRWSRFFLVLPMLVVAQIVDAPRRSFGASGTHPAAQLSTYDFVSQVLDQIAELVKVVLRSGTRSLGAARRCSRVCWDRGGIL